MRNIATFALLVLVLVIVAACGGTKHPTAKSPPNPCGTRLACVRYYIEHCVNSQPLGMHPTRKYPKPDLALCDAVSRRLAKRAKFEPLAGASPRTP